MKRLTVPLAAVLTLACLWGAAPAAASFVPTSVTGGGFVQNPLIQNPLILSAILQCKPGDEPNNLVAEIKARALVLVDTATSAFCAFNNPSDPKAGGIYRGSGTGTCQDLPASADYTFLIGFSDSASITVTGHTPACNFSVSGPLNGGNFSMHYAIIAD